MEMLYEFEFEEDYALGKYPEEDLESLLNECRKNSKLDLYLIEKAFRLCLNMHKDQLRKSGMPYYLHPLKVALIILQELGIYDTQTIVGALLHDTIEDISGDNKDEQREKLRKLLKDEFGNEILDMVESLTKIKHSNISKSLDKAATYRKLFLAIVQDVRVILIKIADRLHNMRTLHYLIERKQKEIAEETLSFYTPMALRLGLTKIKMELEDRSLYFSDRRAYEEIKTALAVKRREFIQYIRVFSGLIQQSLSKEDIKHVLTIVHKHIYEIYQMTREGRTLDEIDNFYSMVINTDSSDKFECYKAHGVLVNAFNPVEQLVDYIAQPRINWYQGLITHLFGPDGKLVEVIIRTKEMDRIAEGGIASSFPLDSGRIKALEIGDRELEEWGQWMQDKIEEGGDDAIQIIWDSIRNNIFDSEITGYTQDGKPVKLPKRSSILDFAFNISDETGFQIISAKVNGEIKPLNYEIQNGDKIALILSPGNKPRPEWQFFVVSNKSEIALHKYFKSNPHANGIKHEQKRDFEVRLRIKGEDRPGLLHDITEAIEKSNIKRISLDTTDTYFSGAILLQVQDNNFLNKLFVKLLRIKGIRSVEQVNEEN